MSARKWIELLEQALEGRAEGWEVFWARTRRIEAVTRGREELRRLKAVSEGVGLRVITQGRPGFSFAAGPPKRDSAAKLAEMALAAAEAAEAVEGLSFAPPPVQLPQAEAPDEEIERLDEQALMGMALELGSSALEADARIVQVYPAQVVSHMAEVVVANSCGLHLSRQEGQISAFLEVVAADERGQESAWEMAVARRAGELDLQRVGRMAAGEALSLLGAKPVPDGVYDVIFHPRAATGLVGLVAESLRADNMHKGRSMFLGRQRQKVLSELVNITDDPLLPQGPIHRAFDDEGSPSRRLILVEGGRLVAVACDRLWAAMTGASPTSSCVRARATSPPVVGFTNLVLGPGEGGELEDMAREMGQGLIITQLMGLHTADPVSGRLSVGASGYLVEGGQITRGVKSIAIAGELPELFSRIQALGSSVVFKGSVGAPPVAVGGVSVSGP